MLIVYNLAAHASLKLNELKRKSGRPNDICKGPKLWTLRNVNFQNVKVIATLGNCTPQRAVASIPANEPEIFCFHDSTLLVICNYIDMVAGLQVNRGLIKGVISRRVVGRVSP